jgi:Xaa-Pro aminopeptidase
MENRYIDSRIRHLRAKLSAGNIDALLVTDLLNIRYLTGFSGSRGYLLVSADSATLFIDSRYTEQAALECPGIELAHIESRWIPAVRDLTTELGLKAIGFEAASLGYADWRDLTKEFENLSLVPTEEMVEELRGVKDDAELSAIRGAIAITDSAWNYISQNVTPGRTEFDLAADLDYFMRKHGADKVGFDTIVVSGPRSALVHGKPSDRRIQAGDLVLFDFGATWHGYNGDITRTICVGEPDSRQEEIYSIVLEAQRRAIEAIRPGIIGGEVDGIARDYIAGKGLAEYFGHGLGHDLGLAVHDGRALSRGSEIILRPGMVVTVEPGIYIPGWGGIRIEDDVLITKDGHQVLTGSPKALAQKI